VDYDGFLSMVDQQTGIGRAAAERATRATLATLADRLSPTQARRLAGHLPPELLEPLSTRSGPAPLDLEAFLQRLAEREAVDPATAEDHARAVFAAVRRVVSGDEIDDVVAELPHDIATLFLGIPVLSAEEFVARVAARSGLNRETARTAVEAVLETLAERVAPGDVDDLMSRLPVALHPSLKRGKTHAGGRPRPMSADEFLERVARREGVDTERAREHAQAVFAVLRESVEEEFFDVAVQLPGDYAPLAHPLRR